MRFVYLPSPFLASPKWFFFLQRWKINFVFSSSSSSSFGDNFFRCTNNWLIRQNQLLEPRLRTTSSVSLFIFAVLMKRYKIYIKPSMTQTFACNYLLFCSVLEKKKSNPKIALYIEMEWTGTPSEISVKGLPKASPYPRKKGGPWFCFLVFFI